MGIHTHEAVVTGPQGCIVRMLHTGYLGFMNQDANPRYGDGLSLVAYFPTFPSKPKLRRRPQHRAASLRVHHHCIRILFDPLTHFKRGFYARDRNGKVHWFKVYIGNNNTDNPQLDDECCLKHGASTPFPLRDTLMSRDLIGEVVPYADQVGRR